MNKQFGALLSEGIKSVAQRQSKKVAAVEEEIGDALGFAYSNVERWRRGYPPREPEQVVFLVRYCVSKGRMDRAWAQSLLTQARYLERDTLLQELFPQRAERVELPRTSQNVPPLRSDFIPRPEAINRVREGLAMPHPLVSIEGMSGVGKTTLARKIAHMSLAGEMGEIDPFQIIVWMSAKDKPNEDMSLAEALDIIADVLGYAIVRQLPEGEKRSAVDRLLRAHRTLVIVDNFETVTDPELADFLQRMPPPSKAIITTRERHLRRLWNVDLHGLSEPEAFQKIRDYSHSLGLTRVARADEAILRPLVAITGGNPKAIELALGYIKYKDMALDEVVHNLAEANETVDDLFKDLFARAWGLLPEEAQRLLMVMPFFADSASREALAAAADVHGFFLRTALAQLLDMSLLETTEELVEARKRYSAHPLVLAFAGGQLKKQPEFETQARTRWCEYFVQFAEHHIVRENPKERYWNSLGGGGITPIDPEWSNLRNLLTWADQNEKYQLLIDLTMLLVHYMELCALYFERIHYARKAADAANKLRQKMDEALLRIDGLGWLLTQQGRFADAEQEITTGLQII